MQGHFPSDFSGFSETPSAGRDAQAYQFFQDWTSGRLPRMLLVTRHATPYSDDSYGVNTVNAGPYGDAVTKELYPEIERQFRGIGEAWSRVVVCRAPWSSSRRARAPWLVGVKGLIDDSLGLIAGRKLIYANKIGEGRIPPSSRRRPASRRR
jgi:hypothetical protein